MPVVLQYKMLFVKNDVLRTVAQMRMLALRDQARRREMASIMPGREGRSQRVFESNEVRSRHVAAFLFFHSWFLRFRQEKERCRDHSLARASSGADERDTSGTRNRVFHTRRTLVFCLVMVGIDYIVV